MILSAQEIIFDLVRQGIPTMGAIGGLVYATADGQARGRSGMIKRGLVGASLGWLAGYGIRLGLQAIIDNVPGMALPNVVASLGPESKALSGMVPETMPNPTYYPDRPVYTQDLPQETVLRDEMSQTVTITPSEPQTVPPKESAEAVDVQGTLVTDAYGSA